jgi:hypothetical protein
MSTPAPIEIRKTLHHKNAFVQAIGYTSVSKPTLTESISTEGSITVGGEDGRTIYRVSDDNGQTWRETGSFNDHIGTNGERTICRCEPMYLCDPDRGVVIEFYNRYEIGPAGYYTEFGPENAGMPPATRTFRLYYRISTDDGESWGDDIAVIQDGHDEVHWADGVWYEKNSAIAMPPTRLRDGTIVVPMCVYVLDDNGHMIARPDRFGEVKWPVEGVALLLGRWTDDGAALSWEMSNCIVPPEYMSYALTEPDIAEMDGDRLMVVMRGIATPRQAIPSVKFFSISEDGGKTLGEPVPLSYPDCGYVYSPGSYLDFFRSRKNDRVYLITNILPCPTKASDPRYPLKIVEVDRQYLWAIPETETVIQDRESRHGRMIRFSNWRGHHDRETGNPVIYMTEARVDSIIPDPEEQPIVPDSYRYEMVLPE